MADSVMSRRLARVVLKFYATTRRDFDGWIGDIQAGRHLEDACSREGMFAPLHWLNRNDLGFRIPKVPGCQTTEWARMVKEARQVLTSRNML